MKNWKTLAVGLMIVGMSRFFGGCAKEDASPPIMHELVGTYMGKYGGGTETFLLNDDHTFTQIFTIDSKQIYLSQGKWSIKDKERKMQFEPFMAPDAMWSGTKDAQPERYNGSSGDWRRQPIRIEFGEYPYHIVKVKGEGATYTEDSFKGEGKGGWH